MINRVILQGRLSDNPELKQTPAGDFVCTIFLVTHRNFSKKNEETKVDVVKCEGWGDTAVYISRYLKKGTMVDVEGGVRCRKWTDKQEKTRVDQFVYIDSIRPSATNQHKQEDS